MLIQNLGENGAWAYAGTTLIFGVPPIISGIGKATDFKFGGYIYRANPNKSPYKILWRKSSVGVSGDCPICGYPPPIISGTGKTTDF